MVMAVRGESLVLLRDGGASGSENMRRDIALLRMCAAGGTPGAVRVYWFDPPCLSVGRLQPLHDVDVPACARDGIDVVRRPSGGRAVLHMDEVTYAVVCRSDDPVLGGDVLTSCARIHAVIAAALERLGVPTIARARGDDVRGDTLVAAASSDCFAVPAAHELTDSTGRKLVGSAQARRGNALLQHGSVLLERSRAHRYLRSGGPAGTCLKELLSRRVEREELAHAIADAFAEALGDRIRAVSQQAARLPLSSEAPFA